jgi:hypothetical protein
MATETLTPADVLRKAKEYIQINGWRQLGWGGEWVDSGYADGACIALAVDRFNRESDPPTEELLGFPDYIDAAVWNDYRGRVVEDVYTKLDERIAFYEGGD